MAEPGETAAPAKLDFSVKLAFGVGQAAEGLKNTAFGIFLIFYYSQVLDMPASLAGLAVGLAVVVDAFTDPLAGSISDRWKSKHGRRHPFMYASIVPLALAFYFLFDPLVSGDAALFVWLMVFTNLTRTAMSLYHVPHLALGAELSEDFNERTELVSYRMFFSYIGVLGAIGVGFYGFFAATPEFPRGQLDAEAYPPFALVISVLMAITIFWSAWGTRSAVANLSVRDQPPSLSISEVVLNVIRDVVAAMKSVSFRWLFLGVLIVFVMVGVNGGLDVYMVTYFWELDPAASGTFLIAYPIGLLIGSFFCVPFFQRFGKKAGLIFGGLSWPFWQTLPVFLRLVGWFPENGDDMLVPLLVATKAIQGACTVQANVAFGSMVADVADEHEFHTGERQEGIFFAASSFSAKATSGLGNMIAGVALDVIAFPRGPDIQTAADIPPETLTNLALVYGPFVAAFGFVSIWCYTHYRLTRERHAEILEELGRRRAAVGSGSG